ncbi:Fur family transcriptional regulator, ferric uptake regulator [Humidesulfovibrio mexicanus]|uniref:Ferric uptake regulation protein n=1 Tax=Humidesulfovibrio mexicanus TaxID=147047 RepID=A0A239D8T3_9BACT|nr:Fur family transcriptional regulator [Humidesulfovibrio mexicanus]SNS28264.1 Fur family transcriptional regulator, ferric uptake regulator [Humidesulfovibrio mexicanus]
MKPPHEVFLEYLRRKGLNMTPQRAVIVETFLATEGHFSCDELSARVRRADPAIGQATVYRTLKLLVDSGLASHLAAGDGPVLYEHSYGHEHHDHLVCLDCGAKVEIVDPVIETRQEHLAAEHGFVLTRHSMILYGLCPRCGGKTGGRS